MFKNEGGSKIKLIDFSLSRKFDPGNEVRISYGTAEYVGEQIGDHCSSLGTLVLCVKAGLHITHHYFVSSTIVLEIK